MPRPLKKKPYASATAAGTYGDSGASDSGRRQQFKVSKPSKPAAKTPSKPSASKPSAKSGASRSTTGKGPRSGASRSTAGKVQPSARSGASRSTAGKVSTSARSGASRSTAGKAKNKLVGGAKPSTRGGSRKKEEKDTKQMSSPRAVSSKKKASANPNPSKMNIRFSKKVKK